eukprot:TRINITY_DN54465_c0_g1_i1.p1 TRINITY_DN54465_c0_g1~~TRINITY_DN54465_c0_g1_i1.p1  ORF type:complete len:621 (-),score=115.55 TRINITY_DN54465_c0_g1_i1:102-1808(-)
MTTEALAEISKDRKMWSQPHLNTQLFLNFKGFENIDCLEDFVKVRCLHLGNNNIQKIEGLDRMTELRTLYLECNRITRMENLTHNLDLRSLTLECNAIRCVSGISHLKLLEFLNLSGNQIACLEDLKDLKAMPKLSNLDVSHNQIEETEGVIDFWSGMDGSLKVLRYNGNPGVRHIAHYRKRLINGMPNITYLDERPVFPVERRSCAAWVNGGQEAMHEAKRAFAAERTAILRIDPERAKLLTQRREAAIARIEQEDRERKAAQEQRQSLEAGDVKALEEYEKSWQNKVAQSGVEAVRQEVAGAAAAESNCVPSNSSATRPSGQDAAAQTKAAKMEVSKAVKAAEAHRIDSAKVQAVRQPGVFRPPARGSAGDDDPAASKPASAITTGTRLRGDHDTLDEASRKPDQASDFIVRTAHQSASTASEDSANAARDLHEERLFALLGTDVWENSAIGGNKSWRAMEQRSGSAAGCESSLQGLKGVVRKDEEEVMPDIWRDMAAANIERENECLAQSYQCLSQSYQSAFDRTSSGFDGGDDCQPVLVPSPASPQTLSLAAASCLGSDLGGLD